MVTPKYERLACAKRDHRQDSSDMGSHFAGRTKEDEDSRISGLHM